MGRFDVAHFALRGTAGAFVLNSGISKFSGTRETAVAVHGMATTAYPFLKSVEPTRFLRLLSCGEIAVGALLLTPFVPAAVAGAALTGFAGGLVGLYLRIPGMHEHLRPTRQGTPIAKDVWLLGIGVALVADGMRRGPGR